MTTLLSTPLSFIKTIFSQLWFSVSSVDFYVRVFKSYSGYGIKYILTLSLISSFMCTIIFLNHIDKIESYLTKNIISTYYIENIDHVIGQLPEINYDGSKISVQEETPLFLYNITNTKVLALDPENKLKPSDRAKLPIILTAEKMIINLGGEEQKSSFYTLPLEYTEIFGKHLQVLTQEDIKLSLATAFNKTSVVFVYLLFPIMTFLIFTNVLMEKSFIIFIIYLMMRFSGLKTSLQASIRMVFFASGVFVLLQFFILLTLSSLNTALWMLQIWSNFLMILGILKASGRRVNFF